MSVIVAVEPRAAEAISWPDTEPAEDRLDNPTHSAGLRIRVYCERCDTRCDFAFAAQIYPDGAVEHRGEATMHCPECYSEITLATCGQTAHAWREFPLPHQAPVTLCMVCGRRPFVETTGSTA